ncbi:MAG: ComEC family competence protein [Bacteroidales bacterium]|nr:ComEC family competence protein [Bacteroidales bacterium]
MLLRFVHVVPTFRLLIPYLLGAVFISNHLTLALSLLLFGAWGLIFFAYIEDRMTTSWTGRWMPGISIICLWLSLGAFSARYERQKSIFPSEENQNVFALVKIKTIPVEKSKSKQVQVSVISSADKKWREKHLQLYFTKDEKSKSLEVGDRLFVCMKPQRLKSPQDPKVFDYAAWLQNKGICATAYIPSNAWKIHTKASSFNLRTSAERMRAVLLSRFNHAGISGDEFSLVSALTLGSVHLLNSETKQQFSVSGVSHILSVSGLHVAVVYAILKFLLSFCNRFERIRIFKQILMMLLLWCYAFMTGLSSSVVRSALMFSLLAFGGCLHRKTQTINTVLFSAFVLLLWKPFLIFDLGFELSYCAVISIVAAHARLTGLWQPSSKMTDYLWKMTCLSAVAQLGTAPLTIYYFHQFPNYFLLNNLVAVPASGLIIYLAFAFLLLSDIPYLGPFLTWCLNGSLHWFQWFVKTASELPYALTQDFEIQKIEVLMLYALMGAFFVWLLLRKRKWIFAVLFCILFLQFISISHYFMVQ